MLSCFSRVQLFATLWAIPHQAPLSMGFSRQEHWSELPALLQRIFPAPENKRASLMSPTLAGGFLTTGTTREAHKQTAAAAAAAESPQSCPTLCDPIDSSPPGSPSLGFSRQEHWSGLPFPSPIHESGKWKWSRSVVSNSSGPHGLQPTRLLRPWDFPGKITFLFA